MSQQQTDRDKHWLLRKDTIRKLWIGLGIVLALVVLAQLVFPIKAKYEVLGWFGFPAFYGFITCVLMVVVAKLLGWVLKRKDGYYDD